MKKRKFKGGFILAESILCLFSLSAVSLSLAETIISGEKAVQLSQKKFDQAFQENQQLKQEIAQHDQ